MDDKGKEDIPWNNKQLSLLPEKQWKMRFPLTQSGKMIGETSPKNPVMSSERDFWKQSYSGDGIETINLSGGKDGSLNGTHVGGIKLDLL